MRVVSYVCCRPSSFDSYFRANSLFDPSVTLYWPCKSLLNEMELSNMQKPDVAACSPLGVGQQMWDPMAWWFGQRNGFLVGICCTGATTLGETSGKDGKFSPGKGVPAVNLTVRFILFVLDFKCVCFSPLICASLICNKCSNVNVLTGSMLGCVSWASCRVRLILRLQWTWKLSSIAQRRSRHQPNVSGMKGLGHTRPQGLQVIQMQIECSHRQM